MDRPQHGQVVSGAGADLEPFLKWAGGKRWLVEKFSDLLPKHFNTYLEPFLGGGAVYFYLRPQRALLSDINPRLIEAYRGIRSSWKEILVQLRKHHYAHNHAYYYHLRSAQFDRTSERVAQFLYLNRTCWNGLFRVNRAGVFNVPIGTKSAVLLPNDDFESVARQLRRAKIVCADFEKSVDASARGDFVFIDPPYTAKHANNGFLKYNEVIFSWNDQVRLANSVKRAAQRGAMVLVLNAAHSSVKELYHGLGVHEVIRRHSVISGEPKGRGVVEELAIKINY